MNDNGEFETQLRSRLRGSELELDPALTDKLRAARKRASSRSRGAGSDFRLPRFLLPLGGMTLASVALFFLVLSPLQQSPQDMPGESLSAETMDPQDLDFYYWLAETQNVAES